VSRRFRLALAAILLTAAVIRIYRLDHFSFGLDEVMEGFWVRGTWKFFWKSLRFDAVHPPLDYLVNRFVEALHPDDWLRRIPAVLWGMGTVWAVAVLAARRMGELVGSTAALLLAVAPFHVRYSQEYRPYAAGLFFLCVSLVALDHFLRRPSWPRLLVLFLLCLATAYTLYFAAVVLGIAALAMLVEDSLTADESRRRAARWFLIWSPSFAFALWLAYLPWWPVVLEASRRPAAAAARPLTTERAGQLLSFFAFAPKDGWPLSAAGALYELLALSGLILALRRKGVRFVAVWLVAGFAAIEVLGQIHPHFYGGRLYLPAGLAIPILAALPITALLERRTTRVIGVVLLAGCVSLSARGLSVYFREGRADWRTLARFLKSQAAPSERIFTENQYAQLCLAYYLVGPDWLYEGMEKAGIPSRDIANLEGEAVRLTWAWKPGQRAWLVLAGEPPSADLRRLSEPLPAYAFPKAEGAVLHRLDPERREEVLAAR
jgi:4-amino-4-deoxy-L-arabinose transferase-like glycosyltransferase